MEVLFKIAHEYYLVFTIASGVLILSIIGGIAEKKKDNHIKSSKSTSSEDIENLDIN